MGDPTQWEPRTVWVRLSARRFFDSHGPLGLARVNEQPQMGDGGHATSLLALPPDTVAGPSSAALSEEVARLREALARSRSFVSTRRHVTDPPFGHPCSVLRCTCGKTATLADIDAALSPPAAPSVSEEE